MLATIPAEMEQQRWYRDNIPLKNQFIVDVGANVGALSQFFWEASAGTSRLISVEPLPQNVAVIRERIRLAGASAWVVEECAASGSEGAVAMGAFQLPGGGWNGVVGGTQGSAVTVPARRLSLLVPEATVVKVDIEGHEYEVLDEALPHLVSVHTWALELHMVSGRPLEQVLAQLAARGYRLLAAGRSRSAPSGPWVSTPIPPELSWSQIPVAKTLPDGSVFKMLHVIATRL
ncbi:MAG TPA: FkbM family methyltransferase [Pseudomonadota bacterium]|nr:FkbM family methyltransferase [Pseudomonadota bacterium]